MNSDRIKEILGKVPVMPLFLIALAYGGYDYYTFTTDESSPLLQKRTALVQIQAENQKLQEEVKKAQDFFKSLDTKREELRTLALSLDQMRATLSESLDIPQFIKLVITEASKVGIRVLSIKPTDAKKLEYYTEQAFEVNFRGVYLQLLVFLDRLSNLERIIRVDNFDIHRSGSSLSQYVELSGAIQIKAFKYLGSQADDVVKANAAPKANAPAAAPGAGAPAAPTGGSK